jgi:hypothetical protein
MTTTKQLDYYFYTDPGHGWLAVNYDELVELGIQDKISSYSYVKGNTVYLEEDCDMAEFMNAMESKGVQIRIHTVNEPTQDSVIRSYTRYP